MAFGGGSALRGFRVGAIPLGEILRRMTAEDLRLEAKVLGPRLCHQILYVAQGMVVKIGVVTGLDISHLLWCGCVDRVEGIVKRPYVVVMFGVVYLVFWVSEHLSCSVDRDT